MDRINNLAFSVDIKKTKKNDHERYLSTDWHIDPSFFFSFFYICHLLRLNEKKMDLRKTKKRWGLCVHNHSRIYSLDYLLTKENEEEYSSIIINSKYNKLSRLFFLTNGISWNVRVHDYVGDFLHRNLFFRKSNKRFDPCTCIVPRTKAFLIILVIFTHF